MRPKAELPTPSPNNISDISFRTQSIGPTTVSEMRRLLARDLSKIPGHEKVMFKFEMTWSE